MFYRRTKRRSRAKFGIDCLFFSFLAGFFFVVVVVVILEWVLCGGGWRVLCTCVSFFFKKCKQRQLIEADILIVHGRRRARLKSSVNAG